MELPLTVPAKTKAQKPVTVLDAVFAKEFNEPLIHQVVTAYLAGARSGNSAQKTRTEVRGGGKKPWKQKGTGRARAGSIRSPLWRGGGVIFAAKKRDYSQKINRKMYRQALCSILSELIRQERLMVIDKLVVETHKTKALLAELKKFNIEKNALIITEEVDKNLYLSAKNLPGIETQDVEAIDPVSLIKHEKVIVTEGALKKIEEWLA
jgi:large subunit ribosomal protein L4